VRFTVGPHQHSGTSDGSHPLRPGAFDGQEIIGAVQDLFDVGVLQERVQIGDRAGHERVVVQFLQLGLIEHVVVHWTGLAQVLEVVLDVLLDLG